MMSSVSLPHGSISWSVICDCEINWSYSLVFVLGMYSQWCNIIITMCRRHSRLAIVQTVEIFFF